MDATKVRTVAAQSMVEAALNSTLCFDTSWLEASTVTALMLEPPRSIPRVYGFTRRLFPELTVADAPAPIDRQDLPGDKLGIVRHKVNRGGVQIGWLADAPSIQRLLGG